MRYRFIVFIIFLFPNLVFGACSNIGTTAVYINGILTNFDNAQKDLKSLEIEYRRKSFSNSNIKFINGYNPSHLAGLGDWIKSIEQSYKGEGDESISDYDRNTILFQIAPEVNTRKILLIGHSQGTFYANSLYDYLIENGVSNKSISVYNLATPASYVSGGGKYLTSANDELINRIREISAAGNSNQPLDANILIPIRRDEGESPWAGHGFSKDYLDGVPNKIVSDIESSARGLSLLEKYETNECFILPEKDIAYKIQDIAFKIADPASEVAFSGISAGYGTTLALVSSIKNLATVSGSVTVEKEFSIETQPISSQSASVVLAEKKNEIINEVIQEEVEWVVQNISPQIIIETISTTTVEVLATTTEIIPEGVPMPKFTLPDGAGFGGGGSPTQSSVVVQDPTAPVVTNPSSFLAPFSTTTISFSGTAESGNTISTDFSGLTTIVDGSGNWSLNLTLSSGTTTINFYSKKDSLTSPATSVAVGVKLPFNLSQLTKDTVRNPIGSFLSEIYQTLGNGFSDSVSSVTFSASAAGFNGFFPALKVRVDCFDDSSYTNSCGFSSWSSPTGILDNVQRDYTTSFSSYTLDSSKYYQLHWLNDASSNGGVNSTSYYGSSTSTDSYPNGKCIAHDSNDCTVQSPLSDMYFILQ